MSNELNLKRIVVCLEKEQGVECLDSVCVCEHARSSMYDDGQTGKRVDAQHSGWFDVFACSLLFCAYSSFLPLFLSLLTAFLVVLE